MTEKLIEKTCKNCGYTVDVDYCSNCGQEHIARLNFPMTIKLFFGSMFSFDDGYGLFKTLYFLLIDPKQVACGYINGKREKYYNPASLFVIISGLYFFIDLRNSKIELFQNEFFSLAIILISLPISAGLTHLFFRNYKFNFGEHFVLALFAFSLQYFILLFSNLFEMLLGFSSSFSMMIGFMILIYTYVRIFNRKKIISFLKLFILVQLMLILPVVILSIIAEIIGIKSIFSDFYDLPH